MPQGIPHGSKSTGVSSNATSLAADAIFSAEPWTTLCTAKTILQAVSYAVRCIESRGQKSTPLVSQTVGWESNSSTQRFEEEINVASRLRKFSFNDPKMETRNFIPKSLLGEGGFGCVFKGWIEENGTAQGLPLSLRPSIMTGFKAIKSGW
ncbi:probable serine/threonine-protein kinase PIX7 [Tanacetum coccineum]